MHTGSSKYLETLVFALDGRTKRFSYANNFHEDFVRIITSTKHTPQTPCLLHKLLYGFKKLQELQVQVYNYLHIQASTISCMFRSTISCIFMSIINYMIRYNTPNCMFRSTTNCMLIYKISCMFRYITNCMFLSTTNCMSMHVQN